MFPLLLRDEPPLGAPAGQRRRGSGRFDEAMQPASVGDWQTAADRLAAIGADVPDAPAVWREPGDAPRLAGRQPRLHRGLAEDTRPLRAGEQDGLEDAAEAEATAMFLSDDPLGDRLEMLKVVWTVKDVERSQEAFLVVAAVADRCRSIRPGSATARIRRPRAPIMLLDRPMPESAEGLSLADHAERARPGPAVRPADRPRGPAGSDGRGGRRSGRPSVDMVREAAGEAVEPEPKQEVIGHWSASQKLLRAAWQPPRGASPEQLHAMIERAHARRHSQPLAGAEAGRSRRPLAARSGRRRRRAARRLLAAILVLEHWAERLPGEIDFNELRARARACRRSARSSRPRRADRTSCR